MTSNAIFYEHFSDLTKLQDTNDFLYYFVSKELKTDEDREYP